MLIYLAIGVIVAIVCLFIAWHNANEEEKYIKAKQIGLWTLVFVVCTAAWPVILFLGFCALMGNM